MRRLYWEWPIAIYLFLGGMGGGIFFLSMIFTQILCPGIEPIAQALAWPCFLALVWLGGGCFLLVFELGQPGVFLKVFFNSLTSIIGHGARILSVCLIFGFFWFLSYTPWDWLTNIFAPFRAFNMWLAGIAGLCIMLYTGILLSSLKAHSFWASPALPVLFTVSALSTACACIMLSVGFWPAQAGIVNYIAMVEINEVLHLLDMILVFCELIVLLVMVLSFLGAGNVTAHAVAVRWVKGKTAKFFWIGMIGIGLVIPELLNIAGYTALASVLVLCGGLLLRFLIVWSDERQPLPGEELYFSKLPKGDEAFITRWDYSKNEF